MKAKITTIQLAVLLFFSPCIIIAQQNPIGTPNNSNDWRRGGNTPGGGSGSNNKFGTFWNSPIYTYTNSINRTRLNGTLATPINGVNANVSGYFGIAPDGYFATRSPWTMLHLAGPNNIVSTPGGGWRSWMKTGLYMMENSDGMYVVFARKRQFLRYACSKNAHLPQ